MNYLLIPKTLIAIGCLMSLTLVSCEKQDILSLASATDKQGVPNSIKAFNSRIDFENFLENMNLSTVSTRAVSHDGFSDAESVVDINPQVMFMVPDDKLRRILNDKLEIIIADTLYKVTENGTLYAGINNQQELESSIDKISEFSNISNNVKKIGNVLLCRVC